MGAVLEAFGEGLEAFRSYHSTGKVENWDNATSDSSP